MWCHRTSLRMKLGLLLSALILVNQSDGKKDVQCWLAKNDTLCRCYEALLVGATPWPTGTSIPAGHPEKVVVKFDFRKRTKERSAHIQWIQRANFLADTREYSFYLELSIEDSSTESSFNYFYNCDVEIDRINVTNQRNVTFHFDDCCDPLKEGEGWQPGMKLIVIVHARPMYNIGDKAYHIRGEATVPDAPHGSKTQSKRKKSKQKKHRDDKKNKRKQHHHFHQNKITGKTEELGLAGGTSNVTLILACVATFLASTLIFCAILYTKCRKKPNELKDRSILVVCDADERYILFINQFVETLKKSGTAQTKVITNVRKMSEIARTGVIRWTNNNINDADAVIFIVTEAKQLHRDALQSSAESRGCSHVNVALNVAESVTNSFRTAQKKFILLDIFGSAKFNSLPFCTCYTLNKGFKKLMNHALDLHYHSIATKDEYKILQKLAASADENMPTNNETLKVGEQRGLFDGVGAPASNNLDNSILYVDISGQAQPLLRPNIAQDQFPSVENNELL